MQDNIQVGRAAGTVGGMTLISRILGFARDTIIAMAFGSSMAADAFFVAFRIPNMQRRLLGEGAVSAAFIPIFSETLNQRGEKEAWVLAGNLLNIFLILLTSLALFLILLAPWVVMAFAPGFINNPEKLELTIALTRWMAPYLIFIGVGSLLMGILNTFKVFAIPAAAPALLNVSIILSTLILAPQLEEPVMSLAYGVLAGGILQVLFQLPAVFRKGLRWSPNLNLKHPDLIKIGKLTPPIVFGMAVYEINILIDTLLASLLEEGSISYLYYGNRLVQLPLGIFGVALGVAILPTLSTQAARGEFAKLTQTLAFGIRLILFITIPATIGLILLRYPMVNALWERGQFTEVSTHGTANALLFYSIGLCAFAGIKVIAPAFYSLKDTKTPVKIGVYSLILNVVLNLILIGPLGYGGLALATSLSAFFNVGMLIYQIRNRLGLMGGRRIAISIIKYSFSALMMGIAVFWAREIFFSTNSATSVKITVLFALIALGIGIFTFISKLMKIDELDFVFKITGLSKEKNN
ncbi:MAG: murein biosynthesis integral membrane protein MurJ [Nitrospinae bacterium CG11_big_fil_rev_8_21_14_0_20_45_15]|nr:MAG: murein biosynthesis integral membrane protein MurJ [Nitrospinae bacterium CG11_big_fil_rev_8_21_14_0_20_45_15]